MDAVLEYIQGMGVVRAFHMADQSNTAMEKTIEETQRKNMLLERRRIPYIAAEQAILRIASAAAAFCSIALFYKWNIGADLLPNDISIRIYGL